MLILLGIYANQTHDTVAEQTDAGDGVATVLSQRYAINEGIPISIARETHANAVHMWLDNAIGG